MIEEEHDDELVVPLDAVHQFAYCPRRAFLMYHDGRWGDNEFTEDGRLVHRRVDEEGEVLPDGGTPDGDAPKISRSVPLGSLILRISAKLDLVETEGDVAIPLETKRGNTPDNPDRSWEPERVQLMAQGLLLREAGYASSHGVLYFSCSRTRVRIDFTEDLERRTRQLINDALILLQGEALPPPLVDSPKCKGCSLGGICLPDETHALCLLERIPDETPTTPTEIRKFYPTRDDALPFYIQEQGAFVGKAGDGLTVTKSGSKLGDARILDVSQLVLCGNIMISAQAIHLCLEAGIPIVHLSMGNWFYGLTQGFILRNAYDKAAQFQAASSPEICLGLAKAFVKAKGQNQRTMLRRNAKDCPSEDLQRLSDQIDSIDAALRTESLLGIEGSIAATYFGNFGRMLKPKDSFETFNWQSRNRRPPRDPINSMLSFGYALLAKECTIALAAVGLDPYWGFYHKPRHGRPSLALDLMEELRPIIVDSAVLSAINTGMVSNADFKTSDAGCLMTSSGRKAFIRAYEGRIEQLATHPIFDYRCSWRRLIAMQAQLLARHLRGELPSYQGISTR